MWRLGLFTALAIGIHNFPESMATFLAALEDPRAGAAIAVPIYYATGRRRRAFALSFLSGVAEPLGGLVAALTGVIGSGGQLLR